MTLTPEEMLFIQQSVGELILIVAATGTGLIALVLLIPAALKSIIT